jgi:hypothetical protein
MDLFGLGPRPIRSESSGQAGVYARPLGSVKPTYRSTVRNAFTNIVSYEVVATEPNSWEPAAIIGTVVPDPFLFFGMVGYYPPPLGWDGAVITNRHNTKRALRVSVPCI